MAIPSSAPPGTSCSTDFLARLQGRAEVLLQAEGDAQLPAREGAALAPLPRRARAPALRQRRGALHRLQALRGDLPGAGDHHRRRAARGRVAADDALRHRHDEVHLLRLLPGGLPGRRDRRGAELRVRHRDARGAVLRQGEAARRTATAGRPRSRATSSSTRRTAEGDAMAFATLAFYFFAIVAVARRRPRDLRAQPGAFGAVADPRLLRGRRALRAARGRVRGDADADRLCRRGGGAVPLRRDDARRRLRGAARPGWRGCCRSGC